MRKQHSRPSVLKYIVLGMLVSSLILTMPGICAVAETLNKDGSVDANDLTDLSVENAGQGIPANPVHYCKYTAGGEDITDWSYVYFGSYPKSSVTDGNLQNKIDEKIDSSGLQPDENKKIDVTVNGKRYRRIDDCDGEDDHHVYYYFEWEKIKWRVLNNDGKKIFLMACENLDCQPFNATGNDTIWKYCSLRAWLNDTFYNAAFTSDEKKAIKTQTNSNIEYYLNGPDKNGESTEDTVFLLSYDEAISSKYGFCGFENGTDGIEDYVSRKLEAVNDYVEYCGDTTNGKWWLRSSSYLDFFGNDCAQGVGSNGHIDAGIGVDYRLGVCPAICVDASSSAWTMVDDSTSGEDVKPAMSGKYLFRSDAYNPDYKDEWFIKSSDNYNHDMACFAAAASLEMYKIDSAKDTSKNDIDHIKNSFHSIGFEINNIDIDIGEENGTTSPSAIALKKVNIGGINTNIIIVAIRGTLDMEWIDNFDPGKDAVTHLGFRTASDHVYDKLRTFCGKHVQDLGDDDIKILVTGHSRGAAAANLVAKFLDEHGITGNDISYEVPKDNIFAYTFAAPNVTKDKNRADKKYNNIFNIVNPEDFVTKVMPSAWGFGRYGKTYVLPSASNTGHTEYVDYLLKAKLRYPEYEPYQWGMLEVSTYVSDVTLHVGTNQGYYENHLTVPYFTLFEPDSLKTLYTDTLGAYMCNDKTKKNVFYKTVAAMVGTRANVQIADLYGPVGTYTLGYFIVHQGAAGVLPSLKKDFEHAHQAQTYFAFMEAVSSSYMTQQDKAKKKTYYGIVNCPVDITITDEDGNVAGKITNNTVEGTGFEEGVSMHVEGDSKTFMLPADGNYNIALTGNDSGVMDYSLCEIDSDTGEVSRIVYENVPVEKDASMVQNTASETNIDDLILKDKDDEEIEKPLVLTEEDLGNLSVRVTVEGIGSAQGYENLTSGDYITLRATTDENNTFLGWYENNTMICEDAEYAFTVKENKEFTAKFTNNHVDLEGISFQQSEMKMFVGDVEENPITVAPLNATERLFAVQSSDEKIIAVHSGGILEAKAPGEVTLTATSKDGTKTAECKVVVTAGLLGDANGDGTVNNKDVAYIARYLVSKETMNDAQIIVADTNGDGTVNNKDVAKLARYLVGKEDALGN